MKFGINHEMTVVMPILYGLVISAQGAMWPYMAVPPQESGQADFEIPAIAVGTQIHLLVLEGSP